MFREKRQDDAQVIFQSLADDPQLGAEARLWLGAIYKARRDWETAAASEVETSACTDSPRCVR